MGHGVPAGGLDRKGAEERSTEAGDRRRSNTREEIASLMEKSAAESGRGTLAAVTKDAGEKALMQAKRMWWSAETIKENALQYSHVTNWVHSRTLKTASCL